MLAHDPWPRASHSQETTPLILHKLILVAFDVLFHLIFIFSDSSFLLFYSWFCSFIGSPMPSPSCPSPVIDQSHSQPHPHDNPLLGNTTEPDTDDEEEEEEEEYAARLHLPVTHGKGNQNVVELLG